MRLTLVDYVSLVLDRDKSSLTSKVLHPVADKTHLVFIMVSSKSFIFELDSPKENNSLSHLKSLNQFD